MNILPPPDPDEIDGDEHDDEKDVPEAVQEILDAMLGAKAEFDREREEHLNDLYGDERFEDEGLNFTGDLAAYDQAAYTRSTTDFSAYRYNLSDAAYSYQGGWMSSWYSGYKSVDRALEGVHNHVATFVTDQRYSILEIVPDLDTVDHYTYTSQIGLSSGESDSNLALVARIDSSLYEKLGIAEAQQHYIVDGIAQVLGAQSTADPGLVTHLQCVGSEGFSPPIVIPNVLREIVTEIMRARGLPLLVEDMPGWMKRVTAFRAVMYVGEPPTGEIPTAFLMYAVWEREDISSIEHQDAIEAISRIEEIFDTALPSPSRCTQSLVANPRADRIQETSSRAKRIGEIQQILVDYVTSFGPASRIYRELVGMRDVIVEKAIQTGKVLAGDDLELVATKCETLMPPIHDHNRTFVPNPKTPTIVRHHDFPDCPDKALLPEEKRRRVELSRKCVFNLNAIPKDVVTIGPSGQEKKCFQRAVDRINEMLGQFHAGENLLKQLEIDAQKRKGGGEPGDGNPSRGNRSTRHEALRSRAPISPPGTGRDFDVDDPDFDRSVVIFDSSVVQ